LRVRHVSRARHTLAAFFVAAGLFVSGCATQPAEPEAEVAEPVVEATIPIVKPVPEPRPDPQPEPSIPPPEPLSVAVVLSNRNAAYEEVAIALGEFFDNLSIYDLSDKSQPPESAFRLINDSGADAVVAIGLKAATASVVLAAAPVVFSQVFNIQDFELLKPSSRGVASVAPLDAQLKAWKEVQPTLSNVGFVIGPGHDDLLEDAELAADRHGVELDTYVASSDQEALFYFKRMVRDIDGFWLLPDNRVLSGRVLREMLAQANRRGVSVLVPSSSMLSMGATLSVSTVAADIAGRIHDVVVRIDSGQLAAVPPITPLTEIVVETNDERLSKTTASNRDESAGERNN